MSEQKNLFDDGPNAQRRLGPKPSGWDLALDGMQRVVDKADRLNIGWSRLALKCVEVFCRNNPGGLFRCEDLKDLTKKARLPKPHDGRAWGSVMVEAKKREYCRKYGTKTSDDPKHHNGIKNLWISIAD